MDNNFNHGQNGDGNGPQNQPPFDYQQHYRQQNEQYGQTDPNSQQNWQKPYQTTVMGSNDDTKIFSILSYIWILWLVGLIADRNNPVVKFHVNQGIILSVFEFAFLFIIGAVKTVFHFAFSFSIFLTGLVGIILGFLSFIFWCFALAFSIIGIVRVVQGRQVPLPIIGTLFTAVH